MSEYSTSVNASVTVNINKGKDEVTPLLNAIENKPHDIKYNFVDTTPVGKGPSGILAIQEEQIRNQKIQIRNEEKIWKLGKKQLANEKQINRYNRQRNAATRKFYERIDTNNIINYRGNNQPYMSTYHYEERNGTYLKTPYTVEDSAILRAAAKTGQEIHWLTTTIAHAEKILEQGWNVNGKTVHQIGSSVGIPAMSSGMIQGNGKGTVTLALVEDVAAFDKALSLHNKDFFQERGIGRKKASSYQSLAYRTSSPFVNKNGELQIPRVLVLPTYNASYAVDGSTVAGLGNIRMGQQGERKIENVSDSFGIMSSKFAERLSGWNPYLFQQVSGPGGTKTALSTWDFDKLFSNENFLRQFENVLTQEEIKFLSENYDMIVFETAEKFFGKGSSAKISDNPHANFKNLIEKSKQFQEEFFNQENAAQFGYHQSQVKFNPNSSYSLKALSGVQGNEYLQELMTTALKDIVKNPKVALKLLGISEESSQGKRILNNPALLTGHEYFNRLRKALGNYSVKLVEKTFEEQGKLVKRLVIKAYGAIGDIFAGKFIMQDAYTQVAQPDAIEVIAGGFSNAGITNLAVSPTQYRQLDGMQVSSRAMEVDAQTVIVRYPAQNVTPVTNVATDYESYGLMTQGGVYVANNSGIQNLQSGMDWDIDKLQLISGIADAMEQVYDESTIYTKQKDDDWSIKSFIKDYKETQLGKEKLGKINILQNALWIAAKSGQFSEEASAALTNIGNMLRPIVAMYTDIVKNSIDTKRVEQEVATGLLSEYNVLRDQGIITSDKIPSTFTGIMNQVQKAIEKPLEMTVANVRKNGGYKVIPQEKAPNIEESTSIKMKDIKEGMSETYGENRVDYTDFFGELYKEKVPVTIKNSAEKIGALEEKIIEEAYDGLETAMTESITTIIPAVSKKKNANGEWETYSDNVDEQLEKGAQIVSTGTTEDSLPNKPNVLSSQKYSADGEEYIIQGKTYYDRKELTAKDMTQLISGDQLKAAKIMAQSPESAQKLLQSIQASVGPEGWNAVINNIESKFGLPAGALRDSLNHTNTYIETLIDQILNTTKGGNTFNGKNVSSVEKLVGNYILETMRKASNEGSAKPYIEGLNQEMLSGSQVFTPHFTTAPLDLAQGISSLPPNNQKLNFQNVSTTSEYKELLQGRLLESSIWPEYNSQSRTKQAIEEKSNTRATKNEPIAETTSKGQDTITANAQNNNAKFVSNKAYDLAREAVVNALANNKTVSEAKTLGEQAAVQYAKERMRLGGDIEKAGAKEFLDSIANDTLLNKAIQKTVDNQTKLNGDTAKSNKQTSSQQTQETAAKSYKETLAAYQEAAKIEAITTNAVNNAVRSISQIESSTLYTATEKQQVYNEAYKNYQAQMLINGQIPGTKSQFWNSTAAQANKQGNFSAWYNANKQYRQSGGGGGSGGGGNGSGGTGNFGDSWAGGKFNVRNGLKTWARSGNFMGMMNYQMAYGYTSRVFKSMYSAVKAVDDELRVYQKLEPDWDKSQIRAYSKELGQLGVQYGKSVSEMTDASMLLTRSGYSGRTMQDVNKGLTEQAVLLSNVADEEYSVSDAADTIVSVIKAWGISSDESVGFAEHYVDAINAVSNSFAVTSNDLTENIQTVASQSATNGMTIDETIALLTAGAEISRSPSKTAAAMKTIQGRYTQALDENSSTGKWLLSNSPVDILDENGNLRNFYDYVLDMSGVWDTMSENEQQLFSQKIAGSRQASNWANWMQNPETILQAKITAESSAGSAASSNEVMMNSLEGSMSKVGAAWEGFASETLNSGPIILALNGLATGLSVLAAIPGLPQLAGLFTSIATGLAGLMLVVKGFQFVLTTMGEAKADIKKFGQFVSTGVRKGLNFGSDVADKVADKDELTSEELVAASAKAAAKALQELAAAAKTAAGANENEAASSEAAAGADASEASASNAASGADVREASASNAAAGADTAEASGSAAATGADATEAAASSAAAGADTAEVGASAAAAAADTTEVGASAAAAAADVAETAGSSASAAADTIEAGASSAAAAADLAEAGASGAAAGGGILKSILSGAASILPTILPGLLFIALPLILGAVLSAVAEYKANKDTEKQRDRIDETLELKQDAEYSRKKYINDVVKDLYKTNKEAFEATFGENGYEEMISTEHEYSEKQLGLIKKLGGNIDKLGQYDAGIASQKAELQAQYGVELDRMGNLNNTSPYSDEAIANMTNYALDNNRTLQDYKDEIESATAAVYALRSRGFTSGEYEDTYNAAVSRLESAQTNYENRVAGLEQHVADNYDTFSRVQQALDNGIYTLDEIKAQDEDAYNGYTQIQREIEALTGLKGKEARDEYTMMKMDEEDTEGTDETEVTIEEVLQSAHGVLQSVGAAASTYSAFKSDLLSNETYGTKMFKDWDLSDVGTFESMFSNVDDDRMQDYMSQVVNAQTPSELRDVYSNMLEDELYGEFGTEGLAAFQGNEEWLAKRFQELGFSYADSIEYAQNLVNKAVEKKAEDLEQQAANEEAIKNESPELYAQHKNRNAATNAVYGEYEKAGDLITEGATQGRGNQTLADLNSVMESMSKAGATMDDVYQAGVEALKNGTDFEYTDKEGNSQLITSAEQLATVLEADYTSQTEQLLGELGGIHSDTSAIAGKIDPDYNPDNGTTAGESEGTEGAVSNPSEGLNNGEADFIGTLGRYFSNGGWNGSNPDWNNPESGRTKSGGNNEISSAQSYRNDEHDTSAPSTNAEEEGASVSRSFGEFLSDIFIPKAEAGLVKDNYSNTTMDNTVRGELQKDGKITYEAEVEDAEIPEVEDQQMTIEADTSDAQAKLEQLGQMDIPTVDVKVEAKQANAKIQDVTSGIEGVEGHTPTVTVDAKDNASKTLDKIKSTVNSIPSNKTITVSVSGAESAANKLAHLKSGSARGGIIGSTAPQQIGERHADGGTTGSNGLVGTWLGDEYGGSGEKKPELVVTPDGNAHLAGLNGWEFENLPKGTRVYSNKETKQLLGERHANGGYLGKRLADGDWYDIGVDFNKAYSGGTNNTNNNSSSSSSSDAKTSAAAAATAKSTASVEGYVEDIAESLKTLVEQYDTMISVIDDSLDLLEYEEEKTDKPSEKRFELLANKLDVLTKYQKALEDAGATTENSADYRDVLKQVEEVKAEKLEAIIAGYEHRLDANETKRALIEEQNYMDPLAGFDDLMATYASDREMINKQIQAYLDAGYSWGSDEIRDLQEKLIDVNESERDLIDEKTDKIIDKIDESIDTQDSIDKYAKHLIDQKREEIEENVEYMQQQYDDETEKLSKLDTIIDRQKRLQDAEADLTEAENKRVLVLGNNGWEWDSNPQEVEDAKKALQDTKDAIAREERDEKRADELKEKIAAEWEKYYGEGSEGKKAYATQDSIYEQEKELADRQEEMNLLESKVLFQEEYGNALLEDVLQSLNSEAKQEEIKLKYIDKYVMDILNDEAFSGIDFSEAIDKNGNVDIMAAVQLAIDEITAKQDISEDQQNLLNKALKLRGEKQLTLGATQADNIEVTNKGLVDANGNLIETKATSATTAENTAEAKETSAATAENTAETNDKLDESNKIAQEAIKKDLAAAKEQLDQMRENGTITEDCYYALLSMLKAQQGTTTTTTTESSGGKSVSRASSSTWGYAQQMLEDGREISDYGMYMINGGTGSEAEYREWQEKLNQKISDKNNAVSSNSSTDNSTNISVDNLNVNANNADELVQSMQNYKNANSSSKGNSSNKNSLANKSGSSVSHAIKF